jgi:hypothetical protein
LIFMLNYLVLLVNQFRLPIPAMALCALDRPLPAHQRKMATGIAHRLQEQNS